MKKVVRTEETNDQSSLLLVTEKEVALLDGKNLMLLWRFNTSSVLR